MKGYNIYRVLGVVGAVCLPVAATAALLQLTTFEAGAVISSSDMNANFLALNEKIAALEEQVQRHPPLGRYCGTTTTVKNGNLGGYQGANELCSTDAPGCPADSHMCTSLELVLDTQATVQHGWYASGVAALVDGLGTGDCSGYTDGYSGLLGQVWDRYPVTTKCSASYPVTCCH